MYFYQNGRPFSLLWWYSSSVMDTWTKNNVHRAFDQNERCHLGQKKNLIDFLLWIFEAPFYADSIFLSRLHPPNHHFVDALASIKTCWWLSNSVMFSRFRQRLSDIASDCPKSANIVNIVNSVKIVVISSPTPLLCQFLIFFRIQQKNRHFTKGAFSLDISPFLSHMTCQQCQDRCHFITYRIYCVNFWYFSGSNKRIVILQKGRFRWIFHLFFRMISLFPQKL